MGTSRLVGQHRLAPNAQHTGAQAGGSSRRAAFRAPVVRFGARPRLRAVLPVTLRADEAGIARLSLSADGRRLAAATTALATSAKRLRLHLDPALVRRLRGHRHVRVVLRVVATDAAGNHRTVVRRLVLTT